MIIISTQLHVIACNTTLSVVTETGRLKWKRFTNNFLADEVRMLILQKGKRLIIIAWCSKYDHYFKT